MRVQNRLAWGSSNVNGRTPRIDTQITTCGRSDRRSGRPGSCRRRPLPGRRTGGSARRAPTHRTSADQIEGVVAAQTREVEVLREDERSQDGDRPADSLRGSSRGRSPARAIRGPRGTSAASWPLVPPADSARARTIARSASSEHHAMLDCPRGNDQKRAEQRTERRSDVAADLKKRLREPVPSARRHPRDTRRFRMKHGRPDPHESRGDEQHRKRCRRSPAAAGRPARTHADDERDRASAADPCRARRAAAAATRSACSARVDQARSGRSSRRRTSSGQRIDRGKQRLNRVVEQVREADRGEHREDGRVAQVAVGCRRVSDHESWIVARLWRPRQAPHYSRPRQRSIV